MQKKSVMMVENAIKSEITFITLENIEAHNIVSEI